MSDAYTYTSLLTEPPAKKALCIYHANCLDGFGSAWAVWKRFGSKDFTYHAGNYSVPPPDVSQRDVFMVDFSYKRDVVAEMIESAKSVHLIDHHISALNDLQGLAGLNQHNSTIEQSGCMLTWQLFHGDTVPVPELLWYIQDRDLWRFELPHCRELTMALLSYDFDFTVWDELNERPIADLIMEGAAIRRKHNRDLKSLLKSKPLMLTIGGYTVPALNIPYLYASEAGEALAKDAPFAAVFTISSKHVTFSLRSLKDGGLDVSKIAEAYGGGGHKNAAGFALDLNSKELADIVAKIL